jgi:Fe2+ transport system protein FeoA
LQPTHRKFTLIGVNDSSPTCAAEHCGQPELCPLNQVSAGTSVRIKQLSASPEVSLRLREMGFGEEQQVRVVSQETNVICQVCHARLGLSRQLAETILVEPLPPFRALPAA